MTACEPLRARRVALARAAWSLGLILALSTIAPSRAEAHRLGESYLYLQIYESTVTGRFEISLSDFNAALGLEGTDRAITIDNLEDRIGFIRDYYLEHVSIATPDGPKTIRFEEPEALEVGEGFALMPFELGLEEVPEVITFDYSVLFDEEPSHRGFLIVEYNWATGTFANESLISLVFSPTSRTQAFYPASSSSKLPGFIAIVELGMEHIWMGFDHVMFLIALLLPAVLRREDGSWRAVERFTPAFIHVVKIVTAFTVAHSVTLSLAALGLVELPGRLVEVVIAASIAVAAAELLFPIFRGRVWLVVFGFGLFHGFGFAGALSEMGVLGEYLGLSLFGFNLGVEIGQVVIVALLFPILYATRSLALYRSVALPAAAVFMILISGAWVVERAFDVDIPMSELVRPAVRRVMS